MGVLEDIIVIMDETLTQVKSINQQVGLISTQIKGLQTMADARLSDIDTELDANDVVLNQIQMQVNTVLDDLAILDKEEIALQEQINSGAGTIDTSSEVTRIRNERSQLLTMQLTLQNQLNAFNQTPTSPGADVTVSPGQTVPNETPTTDPGVSTTSTPVNGTDTTASSTETTPTEMPMPVVSPVHADDDTTFTSTPTS